MSALSIEVPFPVFQDRDGQPLDNGYIWLGVANLNPQTNPVVAYFDEALTIVAPQPLRTINGYISRAGSPAQIYIDGVSFSILVQDKNGTMVYNFPDGTGAPLFPQDSCGINYTAPFIDSVTQPVCEKLSQTVSVKDFGVLGNGTDEQTKMQAAINAAGTVAPCTLDLNGLEIRCDSPINMLQGVRLQNGSFDFSNVADSVIGLINITGTVDSPVALSANALAYVNQVSVSSASTFAVGDIIKITSDARPLGGNVDEFVGELNVIREIQGNSLILVRSTEDDYTVAQNAYVQKVNMNYGCEVAFVTIKGKPNVNGVPTSTRAGNTGVNALYASNIKIQHCRFITCDYQSIAVDSCLNFDVHHNDIYITPPDVDTDNPLRYGVAIKNTARSGHIYKNRIVNSRHAVDFTNNSNRGITRDVIVSQNVAEGTWGGAYATHQGSDRIVFDGNIASSCVRGFDVRHANFEITNNIIVIKAGAFLGEGIALTRFPSRAKIQGNKIYKSVIGIRAYDVNLDATAVPSDIVIQDNYIETRSSDGIFLQQTQNNTAIRGLVISGNTFDVIRDCIRIEGNFQAPSINGNYMLNTGSQTGFGINIFGTVKARIDSNTFIDMVPVRLQNSTNTPAITPDNPLIINNNWDRTSTLLVSQINGTNVVRKNNVQNGSITPVIASGVIFAPAGAPHIIVDTEALSASDDLDTINGGDFGDITTFTCASSVRNVVFKDGTGNLQLEGDFTLNNINDTITLLRTSTGWREVARSNNI
jgi:hypothetical protein